MNCRIFMSRFPCLKPLRIFQSTIRWSNNCVVGQLRGGGGVNQLLPCLNNYASFKLFAETLNDDHNNAGK
jgi:hypothetical protein